MVFRSEELTRMFSTNRSAFAGHGQITTGTESGVSYGLITLLLMASTIGLCSL